MALLGIGIVWFLAPWGGRETLEVPFLGSATASVPDVVGKTQQDAQKVLRSAGFEVTAETREVTEEGVGEVLEQSPSGGEAEEGAAVRIVVGQASPPPEEAPPPEQQPPPEGASRPAPGYEVIRDPTGALTVEVPPSWGVETGADSEKEVGNVGSWSTVVGRLIASSITAAANLDAWYTAGQPHLGAYIVASRELAATYTDDELLYSGPFASHDENCDAGPYEDFDRPPYPGKMQTWFNCSGGLNTIYSVAAAPEGRECVVLLNLSLPSEDASEADREAVQHILDTFEADCAGIAATGGEDRSGELAGAGGNASRG